MVLTALTSQMTSRKPIIPLLSYQKDFVTDVTTPVLGMVAGKGSGKTYAVAIKALNLAQLNVGYTGLVTEPTYPMVTDTLLPTMLDVLDKYKVPYKFKKSPNPNIYVQFKTGISTILLRSAQNHMRQRGINAAWVLMDEVDTMSKKDAAAAFETYTGRLRSGNVRQLAVASTPEGYGWMYSFFVTEAKDGRRLIRAKTTDNHHLPPDYIQRMYANYPPALINAYVNGEFCNLLQSNVYYCFDRNLNHTDDTLNDYPNHIIHCGCDFNIGQTSAVIGIINKEQPRILDEFSCHDTAALIKELKRRYPNRKIIVYPDSSGKNRSTNSSVTNISMLKEAGFELCYRSTNPRVIDRVNSVNAMFCNGNNERRLLVNTRKCPDLTECLEQQVFASSGEPDKTAGKDHKNDALGYLVYYRFPIGGQGTLYSY